MLDKKDLTQFQGSHVNEFKNEGRESLLQAQPFFMFAKQIGEQWEQDDLTEKYLEVKETLNDKIKKYNLESKGAKIDYILFDEALRQMCSVMRALFQDKGYCILIGYKGLGRTLTTNLACFMIGNIELIKLESSKK